MSKHKRSKPLEDKDDGSNRKKPSRTQVWLWLGGFLLVLFVAFTSLRSSSSIYSPPGADSLDATGKYIRRETKNTLSPDLFVGKTASAYLIAQEIPDALDHLYCYCYCDKSIGHLTLLSCFTDTHAANCGICQNEAIDAAAMLKQGMRLDQIRHRIDLKYGRA
jgi:hypothetical protein